MPTPPEGIGWCLDKEARGSQEFHIRKQPSWPQLETTEQGWKLLKGDAKSVPTYVRTQVQYKGVKTSAKANTRISSWYATGIWCWILAEESTARMYYLLRIPRPTHQRHQARYLDCHWLDWCVCLQVPKRKLTWHLLTFQCVAPIQCATLELCAGEYTSLGPDAQFEVICYF